MDIAISLGVILLAVLLGACAQQNKRAVERWNQTPRERLNDVLERERANTWGRAFEAR